MESKEVEGKQNLSTDADANTNGDQPDGTMNSASGSGVPVSQPETSIPTGTSTTTPTTTVTTTTTIAGTGGAGGSQVTSSTSAPVVHAAPSTAQAGRPPAAVTENQLQQIINELNAPVPRQGITLAHLLSTVERIADIQGQLLPSMSQALQHSQRVMELSLEHQRTEIRRLELEAERRNRGDGAAANVAHGRGAAGANDFCYRCYQPGHTQLQCHLAPFGLWLCFACKGVRDHKSKDCPNYSQEEHDKHQAKKQNKRDKKEDGSK